MSQHDVFIPLYMALCCDVELQERTLASSLTSLLSHGSVGATISQALSFKLQKGRNYNSRAGSFHSPYILGSAAHH